MAAESPEDPPNLSDSGVTIPSDTESYNARTDSNDNNDLSLSPPSSSSSPLILYSPPTIWGLLRGAAINLFLPFVNGLMLGFGELLAHEAAFQLGWGGTRFSHQPRPSVHIANRSIWHSSLRIRAVSTPTPSQHIFVRSQSTGPVTTTQPLQPPPITESFADPTLDAATAITGEGIADIPEYLGYLKDVGLDFGYGPTSVMQWCLEHVHILTGTPWWLSIALTVIAVRAAIFYPAVRSADMSARIAAIKPLTQPVTERMRECQQARDTAGVMAARGELQRMYTRAGTHPFKAMLTPLVQSVFAFGTWRILRNMADLPVPGLETGGFGWIYNLTIPDPLFLLPLGCGLMFHFTAKKGGEMGVMVMSRTMRNVMVYVLPALATTLFSQAPAAVQLTFFVTGMWGYVQATLFRKPFFRSILGIAPIPPPPSAATTSSPAVRINRYQPPSTTGPVEQPKPKGVIGGALDELAGSGQEMRKTMLKYTRGDKPKSGRDAGELRDAKAYETKRRREVEMRRAAEADRKREQWAARKLAKKEEGR
ncbi:MAG: Mitochondrial inner membrane protein oxa1 [Piccolia ochrophora]|nr:MAG: Mitochondrial inner membrane protein oxa1 [Piccolia ochrophora]